MPLFCTKIEKCKSCVIWLIHVSWHRWQWNSDSQGCDDSAAYNTSFDLMHQPFIQIPRVMLFPPQQRYCSQWSNKRGGCLGHSRHFLLPLANKRDLAFWKQSLIEAPTWLDNLFFFFLKAYIICQQWACFLQFNSKVLNIRRIRQLVIKEWYMANR